MGELPDPLVVPHSDGVIAAFASRKERPSLPFWPMLFENHVIRLVGSDDVPAPAKAAAVREATAAAAHLVIPVAEVLPPGETARAHDLVDAGPGGRVLVDVTR